MDRFTDALEQRNLEELRKYPKADLHNHFVLGVLNFARDLLVDEEAMVEGRHFNKPEKME